MGAPPRKPRRLSGSRAVSKPAEVAEDIDFGGLSLEAFAEEDDDSNFGGVASQDRPVQPVEECM